MQKGESGNVLRFKTYAIEEQPPLGHTGESSIHGVTR